MESIAFPLTTNKQITIATEEVLVDQTTEINILEHESDLFIFFSTLPKHLSFAFDDVNKGTYFIQSVCEIFNEFAYKNLPNNSSLSQMITKINEKVEKEGVKVGEGFQLTDPRTTLTKELYFVPKNVSAFIFPLKKNY